MDADQQHRQPIMIHRAIFGSIERFFGILVENYAGAFPIWLAPVQAQILPVSPAVAEYAEEAAASMRAKGLRIEVAGGTAGLLFPDRHMMSTSCGTRWKHD